METNPVNEPIVTEPVEVEPVSPIQDSNTLPPSPGFGGTPPQATEGGAPLHHSPLREGFEGQATTTPPKPPIHKGFHLFVGLILGLVVLAVICALTAAVYLLPVTDAFVRKVTSVMPFPVAVVNMQPVSFKSFYSEWDAMQNYYVANNTPVESQVSTDEAVSNILSTMIDRVVLDNAKLEETYQTTYASSGDEATFLTEVKRLFGWDKEKFIENVVAPMVLSNQVSEAILNDQALQTEAKAKIDAALARLKNSEDFATVAGEVSEDPSASAGGDLGQLPVSRLPENWLGFLSAGDLNKNSEVIDLGQVYSIVMATDKTETKEETQYNIKVIIVYKKSMDDVIQGFTDASKIWKLIKVSEATPLAAEIY